MIEYGKIKKTWVINKNKVNIESVKSYNNNKKKN